MKYPEDTFRVLAGIASDDGYLRMSEIWEEEGRRPANMCESLEKYRKEDFANGEAAGLARGRTEGEAIGLSKGEIIGQAKIILNLMANHHFSMEDALNLAGIVEEPLRSNVIEMVQKQKA